MTQNVGIAEAGPAAVEPCPSVQALELIAGKWALRILPALENGPVRNNALLRRVGGGISQKMLTQTLRALEANGLVLRLSLIHISEPTRLTALSRMPSSA